MDFELKDFTKLTVDTARDTLPEQYTKEDANDVIRQKFFEVLGINADSKAKDVRKAVRRNKVAIYELIEDTIDQLLVSGWGDNPFFRDFVDEKNIDAGDVNEFWVEDNSILTVSKFSGNHHDLIRQKLGVGQSFKVETSYYGIKVYEEFIRFQTGRIDWANFINKLYEAMDRKINDMVFDALMGVDTEIPAGYAETGTLNSNKMIELVEKVATATGREVVIVGTRAAVSQLLKLTDSAWISDEMKNQRNTTGNVTYFEGIRTMVVPQVFEAGTREFKLPEKKLFIFPVADNKFIKLVYEGESQFYENTDSAVNRDMTIEAEYMTKLGIATVFGMDFGTYTFE